MIPLENGHSRASVFLRRNRQKMGAKRNATTGCENRKHPVQYTCVHACEGEKCVFACGTYTRTRTRGCVCFGLWPTFILKSYPPSLLFRPSSCHRLVFSPRLFLWRVCVVSGARVVVAGVRAWGESRGKRRGGEVRTKGLGRCG